MELTEGVFVTHHGGKNTVTGSCHELSINGSAILIDCGLFQGADALGSRLDINFPLGAVRALVLTHAHIDHIGRLPWLFAAGFRGPIYCTEATAHLVPLMLEDGLKLQLNLNAAARGRILELISRHLRPVRYQEWMPVKDTGYGYFTYLRFQHAGHILGSAYVEIKLPNQEVVVFSGDLGPAQTPLLPDPKPPQRADYLFLESTYGNKRHESPATRSQRLRQIVDRSLSDGGTILIPAFSIGRTQELLYDFEQLLFDNEVGSRLPIILDSPMAAKVTKAYRQYRKLWTKEAKQHVQSGRHPLSFEQCVVVESHRDHMQIVNRLAANGEPAIVIAASGMCQGGRITNYLKALLPDERTDVVFCGFQASGTLGRAIQSGQHHVEIDGETVRVNAAIHSMSGYSAHADRKDLMSFVVGCTSELKQLHLIHGESESKNELADHVKLAFPALSVIC